MQWIKLNQKEKKNEKSILVFFFGSLEFVQCILLDYFLISYFLFLFALAHPRIRKSQSKLHYLSQSTFSSIKGNDSLTSSRFRWYTIRGHVGKFVDWTDTCVGFGVIMMWFCDFVAFWFGTSIWVQFSFAFVATRL